jgi:type IV secretory pathway TraG/TraD family ATPase VirD4
MNDQRTDYSLLFVPFFGLVYFIYQLYQSLSFMGRMLAWSTFLILVATFVTFLWYFFSASQKNKRKVREQIKLLPAELITPSENSVRMGDEVDLGLPIYLPDEIRTRHVHILGATGSGKTESVILNFLRQDIARGLGAIILDAKGDYSFLEALQNIVPEEKLKVFDLSSEKSIAYNPIEAGNALEAAQRLFSALTWSEEYYKSKALSALQRIFQVHRETHSANPTLCELAGYLAKSDKFSTLLTDEDEYPEGQAKKDFEDLGGLRDQIASLSSGHLAKILSPSDKNQLSIEEAASGKVLYFRLQSLMSPQLASTVGRLVINHLNYIAGTAHRKKKEGTQTRKLIPTYVDEFATFACMEFADLISKARSAGMALHFSHQSIGDLAEVADGFLNRISDNSATKIVLRINDPDSAEYFARSFGTRLYQKTTQRITNAKEVDSAELVGEGTTREAHQFRTSPDLLKSLPTGMGSIFVAHGRNIKAGGTSVFKIQFPLFKEVKT